MKLCQSLQVFACDTGFNLKQEDLPILPCKVSVRNSLCNPDKPTVKCVRKSIYKFVSTSSVLPGKSIMFVQVNSLMLAPFVQVNPFMIVLFA